MNPCVITVGLAIGALAAAPGAGASGRSDSSAAHVAAFRLAAKASTRDLRNSNGSKLAVSVSLFADPATPNPNQFEQPAKGSRLVAIRVALTDLGPAGVSSDADADTLLAGTHQQDFTPWFYAIRGCSNFSYGSFKLARGKSVTGCVAFEVPDGVRPTGATFTLTYRSGGSASWTFSK